MEASLPLRGNGSACLVNMSFAVLEHRLVLIGGQGLFLLCISLPLVPRPRIALLLTFIFFKSCIFF